MTSEARTALNAAMIALADGDRTRLDPVYRALSGPVRAFCRKMLNDHPSWEDVHQQVMLTLFRRATQFRADGDALSWALSLAYWECRSDIQRRLRSAAKHTDQSPDQLTHSNEWHALEMRDALRQAVEGISEDEVSILLDAMMGKSLNAASRKRKQRLLARLRDWWQQEIRDV